MNPYVPLIEVNNCIYCKTLDLLLTNSPSPVNRVKGMPPIGKADHDIVYVEYDIKAKRIQQAPAKDFPL